MLQILNPSGTPSHFTTQQSGVVPTLPLLKFQARKILTLLVVAQVITPVAVYQLWVCIPVLCQVLHQLHCLHMIQERNQWCSFCNCWIFGWIFMMLYKKEDPFVHTNVSTEDIRKLHLHIKYSPIKRVNKRQTTFISPNSSLLE